jgi:Cu-Zn family superoxide dismutase
MRALVAAVAVASLWSVSTLGAAQSARAVATLNPTAGNTVTGTVVFVQEGAHVKVQAQVSGLTPGMHGFHVHEKGDCSAPDAESAGGHFNPTGQPHGDPRAPGHHAGDMPMLSADASGKATLTAELSAMSVGRGPTDIVGKSVVVHAGVDDYKTQPAGNSGPRVACGVIRSAPG